MFGSMKHRAEIWSISVIKYGNFVRVISGSEDQSSKIF